MKEGRSLSRQSQDMIGRGKTRCLVKVIKDLQEIFLDLAGPEARSYDI